MAAILLLLLTGLLLGGGVVDRELFEQPPHVLESDTMIHSLSVLHLFGGFVPKGLGLRLWKERFQHFLVLLFLVVFDLGTSLLELLQALVLEEPIV